MLVLHHNHHIELPHMNHSSPTVTLGEIAEDQDELIKSIEHEKEADTITLEDVSVDRLDTFWSGVQDDLKHDPTWYDFAEE